MKCKKCGSESAPVQALGDDMRLHIVCSVCNVSRADEKPKLVAVPRAEARSVLQIAMARLDEVQSQIMSVEELKKEANRLRRAIKILSEQQRKRAHQSEYEE